MTVALAGDGLLIISGAEAERIRWLVEHGAKRVKERDEIDVAQIPGLVALIDQIQATASQWRNSNGTHGIPSLTPSPTMDVMTDMLSVAEVARMAQVTDRRVRYACRDGHLEGFKGRGGDWRIDRMSAVSFANRRSA